MWAITGVGKAIIFTGVNEINLACTVKQRDVLMQKYVLVKSSYHVPVYVISCHVDKLFRREFPNIDLRFLETRMPTV